MGFNPIKDFIAGISCGILNGEVFVDLDYCEDSNADVDANSVRIYRFESSG